MEVSGECFWGLARRSVQKLATSACVASTEAGFGLRRGKHCNLAVLACSSCQRCGKLSLMAWQQKLGRWPLLPNLHFFHHTMLELLISSKKLTWTISPLVYSVRMQEDYIGKPFCVSPRVSAKMHSLRALQ